MNTKVCSICEEEKKLSEFYSQKKHSKLKGDYIYYNPECKECTIERSSKRQKDNPERTKAYAKEDYQRKLHYYKDKFNRWVDNNPDRMKELTREWRQNNPDKLRGYNEERKLHKIHDISDDELNELYQYANSCCMYCGISEEDAIDIYSQRLHKDHAYNEGSNGIDNCILACKSCNSSKRDNDWNEWYTLENPKYTEKRYLKIKEWLNKFTI